MTAAGQALLHRLEPAELLYGRLLASAAAGGGEPVEARFRIADGNVQKLPLRKWLAPVDAVDRAVLAHAAAPVLDMARSAGLEPRTTIEAGGRWFARLERAR